MAEPEVSTSITPSPPLSTIPTYLPSSEPTYLRFILILSSHIFSVLQVDVSQEISPPKLCRHFSHHSPSAIIVLALGTVRIIKYEIMNHLDII
jgi:hypothetical protein